MKKQKKEIKDSFCLLKVDRPYEALSTLAVKQKNYLESKLTDCSHYWFDNNGFIHLCNGNNIYASLPKTDIVSSAWEKGEEPPKDESKNPPVPVEDEKKEDSKNLNNDGTKKKKKWLFFN